MDMKSCTRLEQVNLEAEGKTQGCEECAKKSDLTGYIYDYVYHVVMCVAVILLQINMEQNTSNQLGIQS
jgi:hypothetical protein